MVAILSQPHCVKETGPLGVCTSVFDILCKRIDMNWNSAGRGSTPPNVGSEWKDMDLVVGQILHGLCTTCSIGAESAGILGLWGSRAACNLMKSQEKASLHCIVNSLRPRRNRCRFADNIFKCFSFNENVWISIEVPLKFVPKGPINNIPALVQILAWRRSGDKPLSEPMLVSIFSWYYNTGNCCYGALIWCYRKVSQYYSAFSGYCSARSWYYSALTAYLSWATLPSSHMLLHCT